MKIEAGLITECTEDELRKAWLKNGMCRLLSFDEYLRTAKEHGIIKEMNEIETGKA